MNKLTAEGFTLHRKDGTEERIVRDIEIRIEENDIEIRIEENLHQAENTSYEDIFSTPASYFTPGFLSNQIESEEWQQFNTQRIATSLGLSIDEIVSSNQIEEYRRIVSSGSPIIGSHEVESWNARPATQSGFIYRPRGQWDFDNNTIPDLPIEEKNSRLKLLLNILFRNQKTSIFIEPLNEWSEEVNYLSFEELIYTSDDGRQFRIRNTQVKQGNYRKFSILCDENTTISEITRGRSPLFVCLDELINGMIKE